MRKLRESGKMHFAHVARGYSLVRVCVYRRVMRSAGPVYRSPDSMVSTPLLRGNCQPFCAHPHAAHIYAAESKPTSHRTERRPVKHHILPPPPSKLPGCASCRLAGPVSPQAPIAAVQHQMHRCSIGMLIAATCMHRSRCRLRGAASVPPDCYPPTLQVASLSQSQEMFPKVVGTRDNVVSVWGCGTHPCSACF